MPGVLNCFDCRSYHRHSPKAKDPRRRVRIHRYWNEDFLVAVQFSQRQFNDLYVWKWKECQNPEFLYNYDLYNIYPQGLFPTAFFLWKHYLGSWWPMSSLHKSIQNFRDFQACKLEF